MVLAGRRALGAAVLPQTGYDSESLKGDVLGGIIAALIMLPLALSLGVLSGLGPTAGIYGAAAVGVLAAVFGGTRGMISGANSPVAVAVAALLVSQDHSFADIFAIIVLAGIIQMLLGLLRVGYLLSYMPYSVISGLLSGFGILLIASQALPLVGAPVAHSSFVTTIGLWVDALGDINPGALTIAVLTVAVAVVWPRRLGQLLPAPFAALIAGTLVGALWLDSAPVIDRLQLGWPELHWPAVGPDLIGLMPGAITIAVLASFDSLVCAQVADSLTHNSHKPNRELVGQGLGNLAAGLVGGVPGGSTTASFVANIQTGGRTRLAGIVCAVTLLAVTSVLTPLVQLIPQAALAGILVYIGARIIDWQFLYQAAKGLPEHLVVQVVTIGLLLFVDVVTAVVIGLIASFMSLARQFERLELDRIVSLPFRDQSFLGASLGEDRFDAYSARIGLVAFKGAVTVASSHKLIKTISLDISQHEIVIFDFSETVYLDDSATKVIERLIKTAETHRTRCIIMGLHGQPHRSMSTLKVLRSVPPEAVVESLDDARDTAMELLRQP